MESSGVHDHTEPAAKRARLDTATVAPAETLDSPIVGVLDNDNDDDDDDLYGAGEDTVMQDSAQTATSTMPEDVSKPTIASPSSQAAIPGLFMSDQAPEDRDSTDNKTEAPREPFSTEVADVVESNTEPATEAVESADMVTQGAAEDTATVNSIAAPAASEDTEMVAPAELATEKITPVAEELKGSSEAPKEEPTTEIIKTEDPAEEEPSIFSLLSKKLEEKPSSKPKPDPEFLAAAEAQKDDPNAEWQFNSSDAESSSSDSSDSDSDDSDDDSDDEKMVGLEPEEIAKILMKGEYEDEGKGAGGPLRTVHEIAEEEVKVEKPDITVTSEMEIVNLGKVERMIENTVLVRAITSGNYQVLELGSLLTLADRKVIGTVADTIGRVETPIYIVRFNSAAEIEEFGIKENTEIFYVPEHSTYVFTEPLRAQKGSDASNLHDEEPAEHEIEFSDDEAEAEHKRQKKRAKQNTEWNKGTKHRHPDAPLPERTVADIDEPYVPLQRPANLHELANQPPPPPPSHFTGGRGGRGGRGSDRGFGRGGRGGADRGGRGGRGGRGRGGGLDQGFPGGRGGRGGKENNRGSRGGRGGEQGFHHSPKRQRNNGPNQQDRSPRGPPQEALSYQQNHQQPQVPAPPTPSFGFNPQQFTGFPPPPQQATGFPAGFPPPPPPPQAQNMGYTPPPFMQQQQQAPQMPAGLPQQFAGVDVNTWIQAFQLIQAQQAQQPQAQQHYQPPQQQPTPAPFPAWQPPPPPPPQAPQAPQQPSQQSQEEAFRNLQATLEHLKNSSQPPR